MLMMSGCSFNLSSPYQAYSDLEPSELALVVPDTAGWAHGDVCPSGGSCSGSVTAEWIQESDWIPVDHLLSTEPSGTRRTLVTMSRGQADSRFDATTSEVEFLMWESEHHQYIVEALDRGLELWVGYLSGRDGQAVVLAFDDQGRVASIGSSSAQFVAEPLVRLSLAANQNPNEYFNRLAAGPAPVRLLTAPDPGLPIETFEPSQIFNSATCIRFGRGGPGLVFPEGTVQEREGRNRGVDVIGGWSELETLPFNRSLQPGERVEIVGQRSSVVSLGVPAYVRCPTEVIYVNQIRIVPQAS